MRIDAEVRETGSIRCYECCPFSASCANHHTAQLGRQRYGFTPQIFEENGRVFCSSKQETPDRVGFETLPENYQDRGIGTVYLDADGMLCSYSFSV